MSKEIKVTFEPLIKPCTYHHLDKNGICRNCNNTRIYKDGYYMIIERNGKKTAWFVDTVK